MHMMNGLHITLIILCYITVLEWDYPADLPDRALMYEAHLSSTSVYICFIKI